MCFERSRAAGANECSGEVMRMARVFLVIMVVLMLRGGMAWGGGGIFRPVDDPWGNGQICRPEAVNHCDPYAPLH